jgi:hypothetical protein
MPYRRICLNCQEATATPLTFASSCNHDGVIASVRARSYAVAMRKLRFLEMESLFSFVYPFAGEFWELRTVA